MTKKVEPVDEIQVVNDDLLVTMERNGQFLRLVLKFDRPEARGTLILEETGHGLSLFCPDVHPESPVASLDLYEASAEGQDIPGGPPLQIELYSPLQSEDPIALARYFPDGMQINIEPGVLALKSNEALANTPETSAFRD